MERIDDHLLETALSEGAAVLAFWHGEQLMMVPTHARRGLRAMASLSRDGELLARVIHRLGYGAIRGSTSRGSGAAFHSGLDGLRQGASAALAVDGPRGPFRVPHPGAVVLAARSQCPLIYGVAHTTTAVRLSSWDRFVIPLPLSCVRIAYGRMEPPSSDAPDVIEAARTTLQARMRALSGTLSA